MSNHLAIAAVTATIRHVLATSLAASHPSPVGNAVVTALPLDKLLVSGVAAQPGLNVFLYGVIPNTSRYSHNMSIRSASDAPPAGPSVILDLHYLITGYGDEESLEGQRLLARGILALAAHPMLSRATVEAAIARYRSVADTAFLDAVDLGQQTELVGLSPVLLTGEELERLGCACARTPLALTVAYRATGVLLD